MSIDRDGVIAILTGLASETADVEGAADRILALVAKAVPPHDADANAAWETYQDREWHGWDLGSASTDLREAFLAGWVAVPRRGTVVVPPRAIDRGALRRILGDVAAARGGESEPQSYDDGIDAILALVRPVEGVTLTPDEASACSWALDHLVAKHDYDALRGRDGSRVDLRALADRLLADGAPVAGAALTLTSDEAVTVKFALDYTRNRAVLGGRDQAHMKALAARLAARLEASEDSEPDIPPWGTGTSLTDDGT